uniref:Uncharacterized protein n=1 Tax=Rhizophora mucronata TaxID=61149 RepID=A0A2P2JFB4_RHIMU
MDDLRFCTGFELTDLFKNINCEPSTCAFTPTNVCTCTNGEMG